MRFIGLLGGLGLGMLLAAIGCDDDTTPTYTTTGAGTGGGMLVDAGSINGLALINPVCGAGDGGTVSQDCVNCATEYCTDEFEACFDSTWQTTLESGICSAFGQCVAACDCGDNECFNDCLQELDARTADPCRSCIVDLVACEQNHCGYVCDLASGTDAGEGGSGQGGHGHNDGG